MNGEPVSANASSPLGDAAVTRDASPASNPAEPERLGTATLSGHTAQAPGTAPGGPRTLRISARHLGMDRFSGVYVIVAMIVAFTLWEPSTFGPINNARIVV